MAEDATGSRIGFLIDGDPTTDLMAAAYEFDEVGVRLRVPFRVHEDPRERWWAGDSFQYEDDPARTKYAYAPPSALNYYDNEGPVGLIGCRSGGSTMSLTTPAGVGTIRVRFAIEGATDAEDYLSIHGLRSEIDGLVFWLNVSAHSTQVVFPENGKPLEITTSTAPVDDLHLSRSLNLKVVVFGSGPGSWAPEVTYRTQVFVQTMTGLKRDWMDHLVLHNHVRDLLRIAGWKPINFQSHAAHSAVGRPTAATSPSRHEWHVVRTAFTGIAEPNWRSSDTYLFYYSDIKSVGVRKWLKLARTYERGVQPLVRLLDLRGVTIDAAISQLGIAVEAIGYQALVDAGMSRRAAGKTSVVKRIEHLIEEVDGNLSFSEPAWAANFARSYNSVKHANRTVVAPDVKVEHFHQGVELLRVWIALRLGVEPSILAARR